MRKISIVLTIAVTLAFSFPRLSYGYGRVIVPPARPGYHLLGSVGDAGELMKVYDTDYNHYTAIRAIISVLVGLVAGGISYYSGFCACENMGTHGHEVGSDFHSDIQTDSNYTLSNILAHNHDERGGCRPSSIVTFFATSLVTYFLSESSEVEEFRSISLEEFEILQLPKEDYLAYLKDRTDLNNLVQSVAYIQAEAAAEIDSTDLNRDRRIDKIGIQLAESERENFAPGTIRTLARLAGVQVP